MVMHKRTNEAIGRVFGKAFEKVTSLLTRLSKGETEDVIIDHELPGITPEMLGWWWMNMGDTERYKLWHPKDHISARWEVSPQEDPSGPIQVACERIGGIPITLRIRIMDTSSIFTDRVYSHVSGGCTLDSKGNPIGWGMHEYESSPDGMLRMRTTFRVPAKTPRVVRAGMRKHNREEMGQFPVFLPKLYEEGMS
jgi:hypothetical protein